MKRRSNLAAALRLEVRRLAGRELRRAVKPLRSTQRQVKALRLEARKQNRAITRLTRRIERLRGRVTAGGVGPAVRRARGLSADAIRTLRDRLRMTREQFARVVGVSPGSIFGWETGRTAPRAGSLARVVRVRKMGLRQARRLAPPVAARRSRGRRRSRRQARGRRR